MNITLPLPPHHRDHSKSNSSDFDSENQEHRYGRRNEIN